MTGMTDELLVKMEEGTAGKNYLRDISALLESHRQTILASNPDTTALVCSWGSDAEAVYRWSAMHDSRLRVAALAAGSLDPGLWKGLSYSRLPLRFGGEKAAEFIVEASTKQSFSAQHLTLAPSFDDGRSLSQPRN